MAKKHHIAELIEHLKMSVSKFERETGVGSSTISKTIERNTGLGFSTIHKIITKFPQVSKDWLETGEGEMLLADSDKPTSYIDQLLAAKDEIAAAKDALLAEKDKRIEREQWFTNSVLSNLGKYDKAIESLMDWKVGAAHSILELSEDLELLKEPDQKSASARRVKQKGKELS